MSTPNPVLELVQVSTRTRLWLWTLAGVLPVVVVGSVFGTLAARGELAPATALLAFAAGVLPLWLLGLVVNHHLHCHRLALDEKGLRVITGGYRVRLALPELDLEQARVLDLHERLEFKPRMKINGALLPGFQSGWYRLRNGSRTLVARAGGNRVLWIPSTRDFDLLLQPRRPHELLQALREASASGVGGGAILPAEDARKYWFPAKQFGWGWGVPSAWQGWVVLGLFIATVTLLGQFAPNSRVYTVGMIAAVTTVIAICFIKGERPRWRWGMDDDD